MMITIKCIQEKVDDLGGKIKAPRKLLLVHDKPIGDGTPYVKVVDGIFEYVFSERGCDLFTKTATSVDELLYLIFDRVTSRMAMDYELCNRVEGQDSRRIYFGMKIELMNALDSQWGSMTRQEIDEILATAPYVD